MAKSKEPPELTFQEHIADFLVRVHGYADFFAVATTLHMGARTPGRRSTENRNLLAFISARPGKAGIRSRSASGPTGS